MQNAKLRILTLALIILTFLAPSTLVYSNDDDRDALSSRTTQRDSDFHVRSYIDGFRLLVSDISNFHIDVITKTSEKDFYNWDCRYDLNFETYLTFYNVYGVIRGNSTETILTLAPAYSTLNAKEKAFFLMSLYIRLRDSIKNETEVCLPYGRFFKASVTEEERRLMYNILRQHNDDQTIVNDSFDRESVREDWKRDLRITYQELNKLLGFPGLVTKNPLIDYDFINTELDSTPDILLYTIMEYQMNLIRKRFNQLYYWPYFGASNAVLLGFNFTMEGVVPGANEFYSAYRIYDEYLDLQYNASRNNVSCKIVNDVSRKDNLTVGQIAQKLLDSLENISAEPETPPHVFVLSPKDFEDESLLTTIKNIPPDCVPPYDLLLPIIKSTIRKAVPTSNKKSGDFIYPRLDYNYDEFAVFYRYIEKTLMASKSEVLECVLQSDNLTLRQRALVLAALYLRQQMRSTSDGLFYEGKLGSYLIKGGMIEGFTSEESNIIEEFITKCETNVEEIFPLELSLHTPVNWDESFRKSALRLQRVLAVDPSLPKDSTLYWKKFYEKASLSDIYLVLMFETDVTVQRLLSSVSSEDKEKFYKPFPVEDLVTKEDAPNHDEEHPSDVERSFETRMARAFLLTQPTVSGSLYADDTEPQLTSVRSLHDMTVIMPIALEANE